MTPRWTTDADPLERLADCRERIDRIDGTLIALLRERAVVAVEAGLAKTALGQPVTAPAREAYVLERATRAEAGPLAADALTRIFRAIIEETRRAEQQHLPSPTSPTPRRTSTDPTCSHDARS